MTLSELVRSLSEQCQQQVKGRQILSISDTSEINLQAHQGRLNPEGLGVVGNNRDVGFFIHPSLVVDAESGFPLGLSHVQLWSRDPERPSKQERQSAKLPIEQKESYKWLASAERSQRCFEQGEADLVTHIGDREADLYEAWITIPNRWNHLLVRVHQDRRLVGQTQSLYASLSTQPQVGSYTMEVTLDARQGRKSRQALLAVSCASVKFGDPPSSKPTSTPPVSPCMP